MFFNVFASTGVTTSSIFTDITSGITFLLAIFADLVDIITSNAIIYVPVLIVFASASIFFALKVVKSFGVRGIGGGRKRRR